MPRVHEEDARRTYHAMFVRLRDQYRDEVRSGRRRYMSESAIDRLAWREADMTMQRTLNMKAESEQRAKQRAGEAA
jgi:hypothetical protein